MENFHQNLKVLREKYHEFWLFLQSFIILDMFICLGDIFQFKFHPLQVVKLR